METKDEGKTSERSDQVACRRKSAFDLCAIIYRARKDSRFFLSLETHQDLEKRQSVSDYPQLIQKISNRPGTLFGISLKTP